MTLHLPKTILASLLLATASVTPTLVRAEPPAEGVTVDAATVKSAMTETPEQRDARMAWWRDAKFGLFIHWGVYAVPAGKYGEKTTHGEWIMNSAKIPVAEYQQYAWQFNPTKYDPDEWTRIAHDAGMKYIVITAKHHDGFALYPSTASKWNIADASPYGKDLLGPLVSAAHNKGLKIGFYYSQAQDWTNPGGAKSGGKAEGEGWDPAQKGAYDDYLKTVALPQVRELLSTYPIDILWWDTPMHMTPARAAPLAAELKLRPNLITNNRLGGGFSGDTGTPEQFVPTTGYPGDWETCMTHNGHWGYNAYDKNFKSPSDLIRKLADICAKGGNFLLNVGPTAEGEFPPESVKALAVVGEWLRVNGESIYGTTRSPFQYLSYGCATRKGDKLYLHVFDWPADGKLKVPLTGKPVKAYLLTAPDKPLPVTAQANRQIIDLPATAPDPIDSVVVVETSGEVAVAPLPSDGAKVTADAADPAAPPENILDGTGAKRWRAPKDVTSAALQLQLKEVATISGIGLDEPDVWPRMKQKYKLEVETDGQWKTLAEGNTNGHGFKKTFTPVIAQTFRITMTCDTGAPGIAEMQLYRPE